ncbi:MAG: methyltransferase domain-containing protein [Candidatus Eremiobacterota bacterium]
MDAIQRIPGAGWGRLLPALTREPAPAEYSPALARDRNVDTWLRQRPHRPTVEGSREELGYRDHFLEPILRARYGDGEPRTVVELGPGTDTLMRRCLSGESRYTTLDISQVFLTTQRGLLEEMNLAPGDRARADTYSLPLKSGSCDVLFASCHTALFSGTGEALARAFSEVHRALRPGGELVLYPLCPERLGPEVLSFLARRFEIVHLGAYEPDDPDRHLAILRKSG